MRSRDEIEFKLWGIGGRATGRFAIAIFAILMLAAIILAPFLYGYFRESVRASILPPPGAQTRADLPARGR